MLSMKRLSLALLSVAFVSVMFARGPVLRPVGEGWAKNSVNTTVFRNNSVVSAGGCQYTAYYDNEQYVVVAKRKLNSGKWRVSRTDFKGNCKDAHNVISIMVDGDGYLHISWDHHNNKLHYAVSKEPGSLELGPERAMVGDDENKVTYPEFYRLKGGNLLFVYRSGGSGNGNLVFNFYNSKEKRWSRVQNALIDGEGQRNAYWQMCTDDAGTIHISWVWRESPDVKSNHDLCYARSRDNGVTWENSRGEQYSLPIRASNADYIYRIPQGSELINQTSMSCDAQGNPCIATYWRDSLSAVPQYRIVYWDGTRWMQQQVSRRTTPFTLGGVGTKSIPVSRPRIVMAQVGGKQAACMIFRDAERGSVVSAALCADLAKGEWMYRDLTPFTVAEWEPSFDTELWKSSGKLHIFVQKTIQVNGSDYKVAADVPPTMVNILEINGMKKLWKK